MMRSRKNMLKAGIVALVHYFSTSGLDPDSPQYAIDEMFINAFEWDAEQTEEKLPNYRARYNRLEHVFSVVDKDRVEIADSLKINLDLLNSCIDYLKGLEYLIQYGRGNGKVLILVGEKLEFPDLDNMAITLFKDGMALRGRAEADNNVFNLDLNELKNAEPEKFMLAISEQFKALAEKFKGIQHASKEEVEEKDRLIKELRKQNIDLGKELNLVKRTSWR